MKSKRFRPIALLSATILLALASCGEGEASSASSSASAEPSSSQKSGTGIATSSSSTDKTRLTLYLRDKAFVYDGKPHSLEVTSPNHIPESLVITYTNNGQTDAGTYTVTASISDPTGQYEFEPTLTATLTIDPATIDLDDFVFEDKTVEYDGFAHTITGTGAPDGLEPAYIIHDYYNYEDIVQQAIDAGQYTVEARFEYENYVSVSDFALLTITPAEVDKSGIVFEDLQVKYDGNPHKIVASGTIPSGLEIEYNYVTEGYEDGYTEPGTYSISARFYSPKRNYKAFYLYATLTITPEEKIIDDPNFKDATTTYDANTHAIVVDDSVLPQDVYKVLYFLLDEDGNHMDGAEAEKLADESNSEPYLLDGNGFNSISFKNAGTYKLQAEFLSESGAVYAPLQATLTINPYVVDELPLDTIGFKDQTWDYDGEERTILCLQSYFYTEDGLYVSFAADYKNNVGTEVGTYEATATLTPYGGNFVFTDPVLHATLTIGEPPYYTEGLQFTFDRFSEGWYVTGYTGANEVVEIPARFNNAPVNHINANAFANKPFIKKIIVGENVTSIGDGAFHTLYGLEELYLPAALENPGSRILPYVSYSSGEYGPRLCTVYLPLEEAELPWTNVDWASGFCGSIVYGYTGTNGEACDHSIATEISGNKTLKWADTTKGRVISKIRDLQLDECVLPEKIDNVPVIGLAWGAGQYLTQVNRVVLPDTYTTLGAYAFAGNAAFFQMTIPSSVTEIGEAAFADDNNLVLYFEAAEAAETFDANWSESFPTSAVHFGYKANIVTSNLSYDYRLDDNQNAILVRTKIDDSYHLAVPTEIDGHPVIGLDGHALDCKYNHYVTLNENLNSDYVAKEALYGTTLGYVAKGGYSGPISTYGGYTFVEGTDDCKLVDTGDMAAVFISSYYSGKDVDALVRYIGNEKDVILGEKIAGKEFIISSSTYSPIFTGSQTLETLTYTSAITQAAATHYCTVLRSIDATNSSITYIGRTFAGAVNLETYHLSKKVESIANDFTYGAYKLHREKDEYGNEYLGNPDNKYLALVAVNYSTLQDPDYVEIHDGCVVADINQFKDYKGVLVIPESLAYSNNSTFEGPILATKASSRPAAAANWPGNIVLEYEGERGVSDDGYSYLKTKNGAYIYKADGSAHREEDNFTVIVPAEIDGLPVYAVGGNVFVYDNGFGNLGTLVFSEGIKRIENGFTRGLRDLKNITFPDSAEFIGSFSLQNPENLNCYEEGNGRYLGNETNHCIYLFELLDGVTEIELPETVVGCKPSIFSSNDQITKVVLDDKLGNMPSFRSCTALVEVVLPAGINAIPERYFEGCSALTSVVIPAGVTSIGESAFSECDALTSVIIPGSVKTIGTYAFANCNSLTQVTFHEGLETVAKYAFAYTPIKEARLPQSLKEIGGSAFSSTEVAFIEKNVEIMGYSVFKSSSTIYVALPEKPEGWDSSWADNATVYWNYGGSGVEGNFAYNIVNGTPIVTAYTGEAEEFVLPATIHSSAYVLDAKALAGLEFETLNITDGVLNLMGDFKATKVILDSALVDNADYTWTVTCDELTLTDKYKGSLFGKSGYNSYYHFNAKKVTFYVLDSDWGNVRINGLTEVVIGEGVTTIYGYAFRDEYNLAKVTLPSTLKTIETYAFYGNKNLKSIDFPSGLVSIGSCAFKNCGIERYYIPASVTTIDSDGIGFSKACRGAQKGVFLEAASIPPGFFIDNGSLAFLTDSSAPVFLDCAPSMTFVDTDDGYHYYLTNGGTLALYCYDGEELNDIVIPAKVGEKTVTSIEARVFAESNATSLTLPEGLVRIGDKAFMNSKVGASGDFSIKLPSTLTTIGADAFYCASISKLYVPATVLNVGYYAFGNNSSNPNPKIYVCHASLAKRPSGWDQYAGNPYYTKVYYYAETKPTSDYDKYWHWVDGVPTNWTSAD